MRVRSVDLVFDAWALWRADRALLLALAGPFWFLPAFALGMLVPRPPALPAQASPGTRDAVEWADQFAAWVAQHGGWYVLGAAIAGWGTVAAYTLYLDRARPSVAEALRSAAGLWPRYMLLSALTGLMALAGLMLWILPGLYLLGRLLPSGPALVAERPLGAVAAVGRGFQVSKGAGLPLMTAVAATYGLGWLLQQPLVSLDIWLRARASGPNPVALATVDAAAAAIGAGAATAMALLAVAAYRRLAR